MPRLSATNYLAFPFRIEDGAPATAGREAHVRGQIEQTLLTAPGERIFRQEFGAGVRSLVFEPFTDVLGELTRKRLAGTLADVLRGEVDPKTLDVEVLAATAASDGRLEINVRYRLATINREEQHSFVTSHG